MPTISNIKDEIGKIGSIKDYHDVQAKLAKLKDEHEKNKSTSIWYVMEGTDIEALEELLDKKYNQLKESKKDEEIIVEEKQVEEDKEENSFPESEVNSKENYKKGLDTETKKRESKEPFKDVHDRLDKIKDVLDAVTTLEELQDIDKQLEDCFELRKTIIRNTRGINGKDKRESLTYYNKVKNMFREKKLAIKNPKYANIDGFIDELNKRMENANTKKEMAPIENEIDVLWGALSEYGILYQSRRDILNGIIDKINEKEKIINNQSSKQQEKETKNDRYIYSDSSKEPKNTQKENTSSEPEPEEPNEEETEKENTADDEKLIDLLSQRADLQFQIMKMKACASLKRAGTFAKDNVDELRTYLKNQAKIYGANEKQYADVIKEYEKALNAATTKYIEVQQNYLNGIGGHETWENNSLIDLKNAKDEKEKYIKSKEYKALKKKMDKEKKFGDSLTDDELEDIYESKANELKDALDKGDLDKIDEINEELKQINALKTIKGFDKKIDDYRNQIKDARAGKESLQNKLKELEEEYEKKLSSIDESKETALTDMTKQSAIGKTIGRINSLFKKINGNAKFQNEIVKPIKETTKHIATETIPNIVKGAGNGIKSIPGGVKSIAEKARAKKQQAISNFKAKIKAKNEQYKENLKNMQSEKETKTENEEEKNDDVIYF